MARAHLRQAEQSVDQAVELALKAVLRERRELSLYGKAEAEEALAWARENVAAVKDVQPG